MASQIELTDSINAALRHPDPVWAFRHMLGAEAGEYLDILIVSEKHPLASQPGSRWDRFQQLHRAKHQFV